MALEGQDDEETGTAGAESELETSGNETASTENADKTAEGNPADEAGIQEGADKSKPATDQPAADGEKEGAKGEPKTVEEAVRKSLGIEKPEDAGKEGEKKPDVKKAKADVKTETKPDAEDKAKPKADLYVEPEGLKEKAKERFHTLVESHKEQATQINAMGQTIAGFRQMVKDTGATEDQFVQSLDMLKLVNTNPAEASKKLYDTALNLALAHNVEIPGVDFLKDFPDLTKQVEDREITPEAAREIAKGRREKATREAADRRAQEQQQLTERQRQEEQQTLTAIETFLMDKEKNDIDWPGKANLLLRAAQFANTNLPMKSWLPYLQQQYEMIGETVAKSGGSANNGNGKRPLRPSPGGGGQEQPTTMQGAIKASLGLT